MTKHKQASDRFVFTGRPAAGTPTAVAVVEDAGVTVFLGTEVGLFRSSGFKDRQIEGWLRLPGAPVGILSLAVSPDYRSDHTLVVGTNTGLFVSRDGGDSWTSGKMTMAESVVLAVIFSPGYTRDGILLAGTLEDGVLFSDTRGIHWENKSFGLLDLTVNSLAISADFTQDGTIFAGTDTAVYYSYNHARAWKELPFPEDAGPVLCLAYTSGQKAQRLLFAGTESNGLFQSNDLGNTWQQSDLPAVCINALSVFAQDEGLIAATDAGLFFSPKVGGNWKPVLEIPNTICLAIHDSLTVVGGVDQGAWLGSELQDWSPMPDLATRGLVGMCLSDRFDDDGIGFIYGSEAGIWKTADGGNTWEQVQGSEFETGVSQLSISPNFHEDLTLLVASRTGLYISRDGGETTENLVESRCDKVVFSPNGKILAASFSESGIQRSDDLGLSWRSIPGPWDAGGKLAGLAVANTGQLHVAVLEGIGQTVSIWQGQPDELEHVHRFPAGGNEVVCIWQPSESAADRPWYMGYGSKVWKLSGRKETNPVDIGFQTAESSREVILSLSGYQSEEGVTLFASTGRYLFKFTQPESWRLVQDLKNERALVISCSRDYARNRLLHALFLGGGFYQGTV